MMGRLDMSPIPPYAVTMWANETDIFVALPMTQGGPCYITRYPKSEGGLSAALAVLRSRTPEVPRPSLDQPTNYTISKVQPQVETKLSAVQQRLRAETTESQRENARKVLAKLGLK